MLFANHPNLFIESDDLFVIIGFSVVVDDNFSVSVYSDKKAITLLRSWWIECFLSDIF